MAELCASASMFTDLGTGQPQQHGLRTCAIAMTLADALAVDVETARAVYYVALLRFLGCTADAHTVTLDETQLFAAAAPVAMGSPAEELARVLRLVATGRPIPSRLRSMVGILAAPGSRSRLLEAHCEVAARLATRIGMSDRVVGSLDVAYARWDGGGVPAGVAGEEIPLPLRVATVARDLELWLREGGVAAAREILRRRRGRAYDPAVVDAALALGLEDLQETGSRDLLDEVLAREPEPWSTATGPEVDRVLGALADFADIKTPETAGRWRRVSALLEPIAGSLGDEEGGWLRRAGIIFDIGTVGVPVRTWRTAHPGSAGWEQVRLHPLWTQRILHHCRGLEEVAVTAGRHHERRDGSGYPAGTRGGLGRAADLLAAAVVYDELAAGEGRAAPLGGREAARQMVAGVDAGALDRAAVVTVLGAAGQDRGIEMRRPAGLTEREVDVLRLLAAGETNRRIARVLGISAKTVGTHVEHIYAKAGVRTRAGATLFATEEGIVGRRA